MDLLVGFDVSQTHGEGDVAGPPPRVEPNSVTMMSEQITSEVSTRHSHSFISTMPRESKKKFRQETPTSVDWNRRREG